MKAMLINSYGADAVFEAAEVEKPEIKAGHVLVNIAASSVNTVDTMIRQMGKDLPLSPDLPALLGMDFAGTVDGVTVFHAGTMIGDAGLEAHGGRVLNVSAIGSDVREARNRAYAAVDLVDWPEGFCRRDIAWRVLDT